MIVVFGLAMAAMLGAPITVWLNTGSLRTLQVGLVILPAVGLLAWILASTHYTLEGRYLIVRSGPFRWRIDLSQITRVEQARGISMRVRSSRSSPALSMDRLLIVYDAGKQLWISPAEKDTFLKDLASRGVTV
jgi:hypothetical protein